MVELWVVTGVIACVAISVFNLLQKQLVDSYSPITVAYSTNSIAAVFLLPIAGYYLLSGAVDPIVLVFLAATGGFNAISFYLLPLALSKEDLGIIAPTRGVTPITVAIIEPIVFFNLEYSIELLGAGVLAGLGLYIAFSENGLLTPIKQLQSVGVLFGFGSAISISGAVLVDRFALHTVGISPYVYGFGIALVTAGFIFILRGYRLNTYTVIPEKAFIPVGISRSISLFAGVYTLSLASGTRYNVLVQLAIPLSVILGYLFLNEKRFTARQLVGSLFIILGVYLVL